MELGVVHNTDCIAGMTELPESSVDLAFADPPFNIGYKYDIYEDRLAASEYLDWTRQWGTEIVRTLKPTGTFWLAIGDDFAAELKLIFQRELGLYCRSWVIWYYTFGVNCKKKFSRSHTHLFHFVKDIRHFTFETEHIKVPSARQLVYADSRADKDGRLPDDTWVLRPQDAPQAFGDDEDVWFYPRVCGTFKERAGWHGCQMPEQVLARIIRVSSQPEELVLDPFAGSGSTLVTAKKLDRRFVGFELSKEYAQRIRQRLRETAVGDPLAGPEDPILSAPKTGSRPKKKSQVSAPAIQRNQREDIDRGIAEAFFLVRNGFPVDRVIADPAMNAEYIAACKRLGAPGDAYELNHRLMNMRKAGFFKGLPRSRRTTFPLEQQEYDRYKFACEIAIEHYESDTDHSLDHILCDPGLASEFDQYVLSMLPDSPPSLMIRWFALRLRKAADRIALSSARVGTPVRMGCDRQAPFNMSFSSIPAEPGLYWLSGSNTRHLYVGEAENLRERFEVQFGQCKFDFWGEQRDALQLCYRPVPSRDSSLAAHQSRWILKWQPLGNYHKLAATS